MSSGGPELSSGTITGNPVVLLGGVAQLAIALGVRKNPVFFTLMGEITGANSIMTLEDKDGDHEVAASKELFMYRAAWATLTAGLTFALGFGDDGVADGVTDPANPVFVLGRDNVGGGMKSSYFNTAASATNEFDILARVPAGKFPFVETNTNNASKSIIIYGVEVDV